MSDRLQAELQRLYLPQRGAHADADASLIDPHGARAMLLEIAGQERPDRTAAITALAASGPAADWLQICVRIFSETPPREPFTQRWADYNLYQEPCEEAISALAGEKLRDDAACSWAPAK